MKAFAFGSGTQILFGSDRIDQLGDVASRLGGRRVLVVSDPGVCSAGHTQRAIDSLTRAAIESQLFDGVAENPTTRHVERALTLAQLFRPDLIVGLGGGSSMDCAKATNFLYTNGGTMRDYWGRGKASRPMLPSVGIPTTAGTGSEAQSYALISDPETHRKMACGDDKAAFRVAILDPKLTLTQPGRVTALTGVDAIAHVLETYVTAGRNAVSLAFSGQAWRLLCAAFPRVLQRPSDLEARSGMLVGASLAGLAIENSMLGAAHALANPLTAHYGLAHGEAVGIMLPPVIRFNGQEIGPWYHELRQWAGGTGVATPAGNAGDDLADRVGQLVRAAGLASSLSQCGVESAALPRLAAEAADQWTAKFNPRPVGIPELLQLYEQAF